MKKDDAIILSCSVCGNMAGAIKKVPNEWSGNYKIIQERFLICRICFGELN